MADTDSTRRSASEDLLDEYIEGRLSRAERDRIEERILRDDRLADALYARINLRAAMSRAAESKTRAHPPRAPARASDSAATIALPKRSLWRRPAARIGLSLAALLLLAVITRPLITGDGALRGGSARLSGLAPRGELRAPPAEFVWTRDEAATRYRIELYDDEARLLFQSVTRDTMLALEYGAVDWDTFHAGYWRIVGLSEVGIELAASKPLRFSVSAR